MFLMRANMTFIGFVAFLDPAKKDVKTTLKKLREHWNNNKNINRRQSICYK